MFLSALLQLLGPLLPGCAAVYQAVGTPAAYFPPAVAAGNAPSADIIVKSSAYAPADDRIFGS